MARHRSKSARGLAQSKTLARLLKSFPVQARTHADYVSSLHEGRRTVTVVSFDGTDSI